MRPSLAITLFAHLHFLPICFAAGPLILPNILAGVSSGNLAAPTASSPLSLVLPSLSSISNLTALSSLGFGTHPRPKDPASFEPEGTDLTLRFSDYARTLPIPQVLGVLIQALLQAVDSILAAKGDTPLADDLEFAFKDVLLIVYKGDGAMTYGVLKSAVSCIVGFMIEYGSFGFLVEVLDARDTVISKLLLTFVGRGVE